jgi:hypothetical protein
MRHGSQTPVKILFPIVLSVLMLWGSVLAPAQASAKEISWLQEGNFWKVSWMETIYQIDWEGLESSSYQGGAYTLRLGEATATHGMTFYPIEITGETGEMVPLWQWIGSNHEGDIYGKNTVSGSPTLIYSSDSNTWVGSGFYTDFDGYRPITVSRNSSIIPSQITRRVPFFDPPITSIGYSSFDSGYSPGSGCEYFGAYGTICTGPSTGPSTGRRIFEFWDEEAGPVAMHSAYDYEDCVGVYCNETHVENRLEVWFFGDVDSLPFEIEKEPDSYDNPSALTLERGELHTVAGEINRMDQPAGSFAEGWVVGGHPHGQNPSYPKEQAAQIHDWYSFEITEETVNVGFLFYLVWNKNVDLEFSLFQMKEVSSPTPATLLLYLQDGGECEGPVCKNFDHAELFDGSVNEAGTYLLGVRHPEAEPDMTDYGIMAYLAADTPQSDTDGDGVDDEIDDFPLDPNESVDTDGDGIGNNADPDDDNDGCTDAQESADETNPLDANSFACPEPHAGGLAIAAILTLAGLRRRSPVFRPLP